jgi:hypothetical protein
VNKRLKVLRFKLSFSEVESYTNCVTRVCSSLAGAGGSDESTRALKRRNLEMEKCQFNFNEVVDENT